MVLNRIAKAKTSNWPRALLNIFLDVVFPPKCLICSRLFEPAGQKFGRAHPPEGATEHIDPFVESSRLLTSFCCSQCFNVLDAISLPMCTCCGVTFKSRQDQNHLCGDCIARPKHFRKARAAAASDAQLMAVIHRFKYGGKTQLARPLGGLMLGAFMRHWKDEKVDQVLPVPLHARKFRNRGFNQSYLLIDRWKPIVKSLGLESPKISIRSDVLIRTRDTVTQTGLGRRQRLANIRGAFSVQSPAKVYGKKLLVVDDVYTTGATANECARILLKFGAERVDVLTLARAM